MGSVLWQEETGVPGENLRCLVESNWATLFSHMNQFDFIILICPTFEYNITYKIWNYLSHPDFLAIQCDQDNVDIILNHVSDVYKGTNSIIILDDCASSKNLKNRTSEIVKLGFSARHYRLSTIIITQWCVCGSFVIMFLIRTLSVAAELGGGGGGKKGINQTKIKNKIFNFN